jgi:hypothetical protein
LRALIKRDVGDGAHATDWPYRARARARAAHASRDRARCRLCRARCTDEPRARAARERRTSDPNPGRLASRSLTTPPRPTPLPPRPDALPLVARSGTQPWCSEHGAATRAADDPARLRVRCSAAAAEFDECPARWETPVVADSLVDRRNDSDGDDDPDDQGGDPAGSSKRERESTGDRQAEDREGSAAVKRHRVSVPLGPAAGLPRGCFSLSKPTAEAGGDSERTVLAGSLIQR